MKNLQELKELTMKEFGKSSKSQKGTNEFIIEVLKDKQLTRVEMTYEISILRYNEITNKKLEEQDFKTKEFQESWSKVNTTVKNSIDTNISKNNREPQYGEYLLKQKDNKYFLELK